MIKQQLATETFEKQSGKGIKIAILDSGVNVYHSHIAQELYGTSFRVNREGWIEQHHDIRDYLGHGTAVAAVIKKMAPDAELIIAKIFDEQLACYPTVLVTAIDWAINEQVNIINLSLGLNRNHEAVKEACERAEQQGIIIVAACNEPQNIIWPASLPHVCAVKASNIPRLSWEMTDWLTFSACGYPRELPEDIQVYNMHGHSFAAAHFSAWLARFLQQTTNKNKIDFVTYLEA